MAANVLNLTPPAPISDAWSNPVRPNQMPPATMAASVEGEKVAVRARLSAFATMPCTSA